MPLADLLVLIQYYYGADIVLFIFFAMLIVFGIIAMVCLRLAAKSPEDRHDNRERTVYYYPPRQEATEPSAREAEEEAQPLLPSFSRSAGSRTWTAADMASSPVGGTCLACGAKVLEETSPTCAKCGAERQRCPVCQRYIAGGQDLLACVHCRSGGHANEMLAWVEQHETCPYCARRIDADELKPLQDLPRVPRRKP